MYAAEFDYYRAGSVAEAVQLVSRHPGARLLAGGHSLLPLMKLRLASPPALVDIGRIEALRGVRVGDGTVTIGALTTHATLAASPDLRRACPIVPEAAGIIGDPIVRNRGTIGGNLAHSDPASDLPHVVTALGGRLRATGPNGERTIEAADFFLGLMTTALEENEVLTGIELPAAQPGQGMAYVKFPHPASRYAVVSAAAVLAVRDGRCTGASVVVGGAAPQPVVAASVQAALDGRSLSSDTLEAAASAVAGDLGGDVLEDVFASAEYRRAMARVYVKRALAAAARRAA